MALIFFFFLGVGGGGGREGDRVVGCFASLEGNDLYNELWRQVDNEKEKTDNGGGGKGISIRGGGE